MGRLPGDKGDGRANIVPMGNDVSLRWLFEPTWTMFSCTEMRFPSSRSSGKNVEAGTWRWFRVVFMPLPIVAEISTESLPSSNERLGMEGRVN